MKSKRNSIRTISGAIIWVVIAALLITGYRVYYTDQAHQSVSELVRFASVPRDSIELTFETTKTVRVGDPIFIFEGDQPKQIGEIARVKSEDSLETDAIRTSFAVARLYSNAPKLNGNNYFTHHATPENIGWVVQTMLPPEMRKRLAELISEAYINHHQEIVAELEPIVRSALADAAIIVREDLEAAIAKRQDSIQKIADRYQVDLVEKRIVPLIKEEIWPIVQKEGTPIAEEIGEDIWKKVSIWRFGLRIAYDISPLPKRDLTKKEFNKFVENEVVPVINRNLPQIMKVQQRIIAETLKNPEVKELLGEVVAEVAQDQELRDLVTDVLREVFVDNDRLNHVIRQHWTSPAAQRAMRITQDRLEPTITTIGQRLFGDPKKSITPEFNRVLRNRVLLKDVRWLVLHTYDGDKPGDDETSSNEKTDAGSDIMGLNVLDTDYVSPNPFYQPGQ